MTEQSVAVGGDGEENLPSLPTLRDALGYLPGFSVRVLLPVAVILALMTIPLSERYSLGLVEVLDVAFIVTMFVFFGWYLRWQVRTIHRAGSPETRWIESLIVLGVLFVAVFARAYRVLAVRDETAFSEPLDMLDSYYYALTVFSTVGFGDIVPKLPLAKVFTMTQMVANLALIGVVVRVLSTAGRRASQRRQAAMNAGIGQGTD